MYLENSLRLDSKEIMISSILGVVAGIIASIVERADSAITGGNATPLGFVNTYTWLLVSAALFGPLGAIITTEVQAFLGLITAANPLSWLWLPVNFIFATVLGFVSVGISRLDRKIGIRTRLILMSVTCALLDIPLTYLVVVMVLGLPFIFYLGALPMYITLQLIPSTLLSYVILRAVLGSRIIGKRGNHFCQKFEERQI